MDRWPDASVIVLHTAAEGWRMGAACAVARSRRDWAGWAEMGALVWDSIADLDRGMDTATWRAL